MSKPKVNSRKPRMILNRPRLNSKKKTSRRQPGAKSRKNYFRRCSRTSIFASGDQALHTDLHPYELRSSHRGEDSGDLRRGIRRQVREGSMLQHSRELDEEAGAVRLRERPYSMQRR